MEQQEQQTSSAGVSPAPLDDEPDYGGDEDVEMEEGVSSGGGHSANVEENPPVVAEPAADEEEAPTQSTEDETISEPFAMPDRREPLIEVLAEEDFDEVPTVPVGTAEEIAAAVAVANLATELEEGLDMMD